MSVNWDEEARPDLVRIEVGERIARGWILALRVVRAELFRRAYQLTVKGEADDRARLLGAYSGLAHLSEMLAEAVGSARAETEEEAGSR